MLHYGFLYVLYVIDDKIIFLFLFLLIIFIFSRILSMSGELLLYDINTIRNLNT